MNGSERRENNRQSSYYDELIWPLNQSRIEKKADFYKSLPQILTNTLTYRCTSC